MKRPADQAKLLFLYLLRSSAAALATDSTVAGSKIAPAAAAAAATSGSPSAAANTATTCATAAAGGHISLRLARRTDVPMIQRCNIASLPENYNANFYVNHMRRWPELALVAEHVPEGSSNNKAAAVNGAASRKSNFLGSGYDPENSNVDCEVIGYVLGKVDEKAIPAELRYKNSPSLTSSHRGRLPSGPSGLTTEEATNLLNSYILPPPTEMMGHVTSLAILKPYRRKGLANQLMNQLHHHMKHSYRADAVGLHVRVSNEAATKLYRDGMGYRVADVIKGYYQDGEDAYFMRKDFDEEEENVASRGVERGERRGDVAAGGAERNGEGSMGRRVRRSWSNLRLNLGGGGGGRNGEIWEVGPEELRLPRDIPLITEEADNKEPVVIDEQAVAAAVAAAAGRASSSSLSQNKKRKGRKVMAAIAAPSQSPTAASASLLEEEEDEEHEQVMTGTM